MSPGWRHRLVDGTVPPDLRLAGLAVATWLSALAALHTRAPVAIAATVVALAGAAVVWRRWNRRAWAGIAVALLLGMACGSGATAARLALRDVPAVAGPASAHASATVDLTIRRDPHQLGADAGRPATLLIPAWLHRLETDRAGPVRVRARILVFANDAAWQGLLPGQRVRAIGRLGPPRGGDLTAAVLSATGPPQRLGDPPWPQRAAGSLRTGLRAATTPLPPEPGGLLPGLAIGDVDRMDPIVQDDFRTTGMSHLTAVSGTNVTIVIGFIVLLAGAARAPPWLTAAVAGAGLVGYVILCRPDPSVIRAGAMGAVALLALASGRPAVALPALGTAVTGLVVIDPQLAGDVGFAMSVLATGGLLLLAPRWRVALRRRGVPVVIADALAIPAAAQVSVAPVIAATSGTVSLVAVAANLAATPAVAPATVLGVLAAVASPIGPVAELLAWLGSWPAWWLVLVARFGARLPAAEVPWPDGVAGGLLLTGITVAGLVTFRHRRVRVLAAVVAAAVVVGALPVRTVASGWPPAHPVLVACTVGQGDLLVLPLPGRAAVVVDAGPDSAAADRCLRDLRVSSIPLLVISHFHVDHVGGIEGVFRGRRVGAVLTSGLPEPEYGHSLVATTAAAAGTPVQPAQPGASYLIGELALTVLGPAYQPVGTRSDPNNNSVVLMAQVRGTRVLLAGDAEVELQQALLAELGPDRLRADVLKVPHHGSLYQLPEFLDAVDPRVAIVPVGADNRFGHPHPAVVDRLQRDGARVLRTDTQGDVAAVLPNDGDLAVIARGSPTPQSAPAARGPPT